MRFISAQEISSILTWKNAIQALHQAHMGERPSGDHYFVGDTGFGLFSRGVILPGYGAGIKLASIYPQNLYREPPLPAEHAAFVVFDEKSKAVSALLDGPAITRYKTAADSALAAQLLSREDSQVLLVAGAGPIAQSLTQAYLYIRPSIREVILWNRTSAKLQPFCRALCDQGINATISTCIESSISRADIITSATSAESPFIRGEWIRPGTHVDLVGGYRQNMQEADEHLMQKARIFVDDMDSALQSGDLFIPLSRGDISQQRIEDDLFSLCQRQVFNRSYQDITVFKNAGGAHQDLAISQYVINHLPAHNSD